MEYNSDQVEKTLEEQEIVSETIEEYSSSDEKKAIKKKARDLIKHQQHGDNLSLIESKLMSRREQVLLIQEYFKYKFWKDLWKIILAALIATVTFDYFITTTGRTGLFPAGVGAIARFFAILAFQNDEQMQGSFYFIFYFLINIPFFIFGYIKLGKKFSFITLLYIVLQIGFDQIIQNIPVINPSNFHMIIDYKLVYSQQGSWNTAIWLFIFAGLGGVFLGFAYSILYKTGASTGGSDFITIYFSKVKNKPIGSINRDVNFIILGVVIILNTTILPIGMIPSDIKIKILSGMSFNEFNETGMGKSMIDWALHNGALIQVGPEAWVFDPTFVTWFPQIQSGQTFKSLEEAIDFVNNQNLEVNQYNYQYLINFVCTTGYGDDLSAYTWIAFKIKLAFIFGPSLFASVVLVLCVGLTTNAFYPKFKVRTYMITTNKPREINTCLLENGFQNDIVTWDGTNRINGNYLHRSVIMVAMSVMNWADVQEKIFLIDPEAKVNVLKTKNVKGIFTYEIKKNDERTIIHNKVKNDEKELEKIRQIAIVRLNKEQEKKTKKQKKKQK